MAIYSSIGALPLAVARPAPRPAVSSSAVRAAVRTPVARVTAPASPALVVERPAPPPPPRFVPGGPTAPAGASSGPRTLGKRLPAPAPPPPPPPAAPEVIDVPGYETSAYGVAAAAGGGADVASDAGVMPDAPRDGIPGWVAIGAIAACAIVGVLVLRHQGAL